MIRYSYRTKIYSKRRWTIWAFIKR